MTITEAQKQGVAAFLAGKPVAPVLNRDFFLPACKSGRFVELAKAYNHGWTVASLAKDAPEGAPSIKSLARILAG